MRSAAAKYRAIGAVACWCLTFQKFYQIISEFLRILEHQKVIAVLGFREGEERGTGED